MPKGAGGAQAATIDYLPFGNAPELSR